MLCGSYVHGQMFNEGDNFVSVGYGFAVINANSLLDIYDQEDAFDNINFGPVNLQFEHALDENVGIGLDLGYSKIGATWQSDGFLDEEDVVYNYEYTRTKLTINFRANYHFDIDEAFDPYAGLGAGLRITNWNYTSDDDDFQGTEFSNLIPVSLLLRFGVRVKFTDNLSGFLEGGAGHGIIQGGLALKL